MTDRTRRNDDDMEQDDMRTGTGQGDSQGRSTSPHRDDDDREGNRGGGDDTSRRSPGQGQGHNPQNPQKKK